MDAEEGPRAPAVDGASLQPDESEGCSPVPAVGLIRLNKHQFLSLRSFGSPDDPLTHFHAQQTRLLKVEVAASVKQNYRGDGSW